MTDYTSTPQPRAPVPFTITDEILRFCNHLVPGVRPFYLPVTPTPDAKPLHCFPNVAAVTKAKGGKTQYGWIIWERPDIMYEAEFHAVWLKDDGTRVDVTPQNEGITNILFLPDDLRVYDGVRPIYNELWPLYDSESVRKYLKTNRELNHEKDKGVFIPGTSLARYEPSVAARIDELQQTLVELQMVTLQESALRRGTFCSMENENGELS